ncbi:hypothetical protein GU926_07175 [Nibribacter ruber]|uniref:Uncharacterized protein n=1 Tax=Nibribacter ruber TaxID=2698458 RepID=A0A6P1NXZ6_9BACT|nr:hypothetical protein [Nibribacter ruber]QHL87224.1 hypothetical protein GU926_07175 [Nibribacter ruber]
MENFKIGQYLLLIVVIQALTTLGFGFIQEGGDWEVVPMYPVVYLLPAVFINYLYGLLLQIFSPKLPANGFWILWFILGTGFLLVNELFIQGATVMVHFIVLAAAFLNLVYFYKDLGRKKPTYQNPS